MSPLVLVVVGFFTEFAWLAWVAFAAKGWPLRTALASVAIGGFGLLGVTGAVNGRWESSACLLVGYFLGSYAAAWINRPRTRPHPESAARQERP